MFPILKSSKSNWMEEVDNKIKTLGYEFETIDSDFIIWIIFRWTENGADFLFFCLAFQY